MSAPLRVRTRLGSLSLTVEGDAGPVAALLRELQPRTYQVDVGPPPEDPEKRARWESAVKRAAPSYRIHKLEGRSASVTDLDLIDINNGLRPEGLTDRQYDEAKALARKLAGATI